MNPKEKLEALKKQALAIATKAKSEGRGFTPSEQRDIDAKMSEIDQLKSDIAAGEKSARILAELDDMARGVQRDSGDTEYLSFGKAFAHRAAERTLPQGQKALATGFGVFVDPEFTRTPIPIGRPATSLLDLIPVQRHGQPAYSYLRQSVRTNNAAVVAEGATKPTSTYSIIKVDGALSVIAHLSEPVPRYWFEDAAALRPFMSDELAYGLQLAVESKILADINATSGMQLQAFATSKLVTLRKALTKLDIFGYTPSAIVVNPLDWEDIELALASTTAVEHNGLPYDAATRRLWGTPIVVANVQAQNTAHVLSAGAAAVDTDTAGVIIQWSETSNATDFQENKVRARCEGRYGTSVYQPMGIVKADLAA